LTKPTIPVFSDLDFNLPCVSLVGIHEAHSVISMLKVFSIIR
jgi:hypothetical protein